MLLLTLLLLLFAVALAVAAALAVAVSVAGRVFCMLRYFAGTSILQVEAFCR